MVKKVLFQINQLNVDSAVKRVLDKMKAFNPSAASSTNTTDPFAALIEWAHYSESTRTSLPEAEWRKLEVQRQLQKSMMNFIGDAHQEIIGTLAGWISNPTGTGKPDVEGNRGKQKIIAEIKNKQNTTNHDSASSVINKLKLFLEDDNYLDYIAFKVSITKPQTSRTKLWRYLDNQNNKKLLDVSGKVFYAIATDPNERVPEVDFHLEENMQSWKSWTAFDYVTHEIIKSVEKNTGYVIPTWLLDLFRSEISWEG